MDQSSVTGGTSFVILSVTIVGILATALLLLSYYLFLTRCGLLFFWRSDHLHVVVRAGEEQEEPQLRRRGLHEAAIRRLPTLRYQISSTSDHKSAVDCAVCLADFRHGERLRQLPPCRHAFHIDCIDVWLQATANCPLCRATVSALPETAAVAIDISSLAAEESPAPECQLQPEPVMRSRRSLSMDSCTDKRLYLALQRMLHNQEQQLRVSTPPVLPPQGQGRSLRRSFFSFSHSHSRSATILPI